MLFWTTLVVAIVFGVLAYWFFHTHKFDLDVLGMISTGISSIAGIIAFIMLFVVMTYQIGAPTTKEKLQITYESLIYQLENNFYDNDNDYGKKELYDQITEYNQDVSVGKKLQRSFWFGIFLPNIYDDLELIELKGR